MISVELSQKEVDCANKIAAKINAYRSRQTDKRIHAEKAGASLYSTNVLAKMAVAKFMDLDYTNSSKLRAKGFLSAEFLRDKMIVPLWVKGTRCKSVQKVVHLPESAQFPSVKCPLIFCTVLNDYLVQLAGWAFSTDILASLRPKQTSTGIVWSFDGFNDIEVFEPVFADMLEKLEKLTVPYRVPCKHLSTPMSLKDSARLV